jgi:hypothetical protein
MERRRITVDINDEKTLTEEEQEVISRRAITKKAAYVVPAVLAVIGASQRPALAASSGGSGDGGDGKCGDGKGGYGGGGGNG